MERSGEMGILSLPIEIQEYILSFLDFSSLINCSKVCLVWSDLTRGCWHKCCLREISDDVLTEIFGCSHPAVFLRQMTPLAWKALFLRWSHYAVAKKTPHQKFSLPFKNNLLNKCIVRLSGDFLILAPTAENVRVYKVYIYESGRCIGILAKHNNSIQDIGIMDVQNEGPYKLKGSNKIAEHNVVISISLDKSIQINEFNCHSHQPIKLWETYLVSDCLNAVVKIFGNMIVVACQDRSIYIWSVSHVNLGGSLLIVEDIGQTLCPIPITDINIWKNKVMCFWWNLTRIHLLTWDLTKQTWIENYYFENVLRGLTISIFRNLIFEVGTQLTILRKCQFYQKYESWETLGKSSVLVEMITAVCLKRNLLIIGTKMGEVHIFLISDDEDLRDLKSILPLNVIKIATSFVQSQQEIQNLDISFDGTRLQIAAQTCQAVHIIHWFPFDKELQCAPKIELPIFKCYQEDNLIDPDYWFYDSD